MRVLLLGSGGREHAIARALARSRQNPRVFCFAGAQNPLINEIAVHCEVGSATDPAAVVRYAKKQSADFAVVGPEAPLEAGVVDALSAEGIPSVGPPRTLAQIETSKSFTRKLLVDYGITAYPRHQYFFSLEGVPEYLQELEGQYVVKADGLMGGKGVKLSGDHLRNDEETLAWCRHILGKGMGFLVEEKLLGEEFSLMSFSDGEHLSHMPAVQDHKRLQEGDTGPQTGGMGSYSDADHGLPFLTEGDIEQAREINRQTAQALKDKFGEGYKGILYGGFMATKDGVKLIEYNARFADPEGINVLPLLESDFLDVCRAVMEGTLSPGAAKFAKKATVCKYAVPDGHPDHPVKDAIIVLAPGADKSRLYFAGVDEREGVWYCTGARAVASLGIADSLEEAERIAESELQNVKGPLYHRNDIGTKTLIEKRIAHMRRLRGL